MKEIIYNIEKKSVVIVSLILAFLFGIIIIFFSSNLKVSEETAKCIGENSVLYVQLGCISCEKQKDMFGENVKYINFIDCFYETEKCIESEISTTPTWIINNQKYKGFQDIKKLKELTKCQ